MLIELVLKFHVFTVSRNVYESCHNLAMSIIVLGFTTTRLHFVGIRDRKNLKISNRQKLALKGLNFR